MSEVMREAHSAQVQRLREELRGVVRNLEGCRRWEATHNERAGYEQRTEKLVGQSALLALEGVDDRAETRAATSGREMRVATAFR